MFTARLYCGIIVVKEGKIMEYCLCIKPNDKNLLHIVARYNLRSAFFTSYKVVATADNEMEAFVLAAALVQDYCDAHGSEDFSHFGKWIREARP